MSLFLPQAAGPPPVCPNLIGRRYLDTHLEAVPWPAWFAGVLSMQNTREFVALPLAIYYNLARR